MENKLITVSGVTGYIDENGVAQLNLENVARGLGFVTTVTSVEYVRWQRVADYLEEFKFLPLVAKEDREAMTAAQIRAMLPEFIPENIFYRLAMKANNKTAVDFQCKIADEILPSIRQHGIYATNKVIDNILADPDYGIRLLTELKTERIQRQQLELENAQSKQIIGELRPKASYYDLILQNKSLIPITKIAKDYGMSGKAMNSLLHELGVQYRMGNIWLLYQKYAEMGLTQSRTHVIDAEKSVIHTYWTQKGRLFLYDLLKNKKNILPLIERQGGVIGA